MTAYLDNDDDIMMFSYRDLHVLSLKYLTYLTILIYISTLYS